MFRFLKDKLKGAVGKFAKKVEEESVEEKVEVVKEKKVKPKKEKVEPKPKKRLFKKKEKESIVEPEEVIQEKPKKGLFKKVTSVITQSSLSDAKFEELFWDLELVLLENNVAVKVIEKLKNDLKNELVDKKFARGKTKNIIIDTLKNSLEEVLGLNGLNIIKEAKKKKPYVILFVGINGSGKTTTIAKVASMLKKNKFSSVLAAADTFRAAAIDQLEAHANKVGAKLIKHDYGADPAAVGYDAIEYAKKNNIDFVLIDTAGRLHSNVNLMEELKKIVRITKPDLKIFIGDSLTGNDVVEQAEQFNELIGVDALILCKADADEKGGATISTAYVTQKPVLYLGVGQGYDDLEKFSPDKIVEKIIS
ncbi:signal recognition particle-docking protein FtsY [Candidatus Woesearchaeota archaeon]|nr:signal recognition particle-docking protein FtsY [Candidatus Woesearchaeota archaeon]